MASARTRAPARPAIVLTAEDHHLLSRLAAASAGNMAELSAELGRELDRARLLPAGRSSPDHVRIGSVVTFRDEASGRESTVTLVRPEEADIAQGRVSVMTPVGVALIGMAVGRSIDWTTRAGEVKRLTVVDVTEAAEPAEA